MALVASCQENGHAIAGRGWDIYGDWDDDPGKRRTDVYYVVAPFALAQAAPDTLAQVYQSAAVFFGRIGPFSVIPLP